MNTGKRKFINENIILTLNRAIAECQTCSFARIYKLIRLGFTGSATPYSPGPTYFKLQTSISIFLIALLHRGNHPADYPNFLSAYRLWEKVGILRAMEIFPCLTLDVTFFLIL